MTRYPFARLACAKTAIAASAIGTSIWAFIFRGFVVMTENSSAGV